MEQHRIAIPGLALLAAVPLFLASPAAASSPAPATPSERPGRYAMAPTDGGFMRLDTETGQMAFCGRAAEQWSCRAIDDQSRADREVIEKLRAENADLRRTIKQLEEMVVGLEKPEDRQASKPTLRLPSEKEVEEGLDYIERMFKKFRDRLRQLEGGEKGTPL